jgi:hypothetical protein
VVGVPEGSSIERLQTPTLKMALAGDPAAPLQVTIGRQRIGITESANSLVSVECAVAEKSGVGPQAPFFHAEI